MHHAKLYRAEGADALTYLGPVWIQVVPPVVLFVPKVQIVLIVPNK
jgi:hypothetical protein